MGHKAMREQSAAAIALGPSQPGTALCFDHFFARNSAPSNLHTRIQGKEIVKVELDDQQVCWSSSVHHVVLFRVFFGVDGTSVSCRTTTTQFIPVLFSGTRALEGNADGGQKSAEEYANLLEKMKV